MHVTKPHDTYYVYFFYEGIFIDYKLGDITVNMPTGNARIDRPLYVGKTFDMHSRLRDHNKPGHLLSEIRKQYNDVTVRCYECDCEGLMSTLEQALIFKYLPRFNDESSRNTKPIDLLSSDTAKATIYAMQVAYFHNPRARLNSEPTESVTRYVQQTLFV